MSHFVVAVVVFIRPIFSKVTEEYNVITTARTDGLRY